MGDTNLHYQPSRTYNASILYPHPPVEPPSRQRKGALSQLHPELVQEVRLHEGALFVEACKGVVSAAVPAAAAPGGECGSGGGVGRDRKGVVMI